MLVRFDHFPKKSRWPWKICENTTLEKQPKSFLALPMIPGPTSSPTRQSGSKWLPNATEGEWLVNWVGQRFLLMLCTQAWPSRCQLGDLKKKNIVFGTQQSDSSKDLCFSGWCSTPTLLLICSSFRRENGHPLLICSSLSTVQFCLSVLLKRIVEDMTWSSFWRIHDFLGTRTQVLGTLRPVFGSR